MNCRQTFSCIVVFWMASFSCLFSQELSFGIRAGLNYSKFVGPSEENADESFSLTGGFHFGINIGYSLNDFVSLRSGFLYVQGGTKQKYEGNGYYLFNTPTRFRVPLFDSTRINLDISNAYLTIPLTVHVRVTNKWEIHGGLYGSILISPVGAGKLLFGSQDSVNYIFEQGWDYRYKGDRAGGFNTLIEPIQLIVNGEDANVPSIAGAYYLYTAKDGNLFNSLDYGLTGGVSYFINPGLYLGLKMDYGLRDVTNNKMDRSFQDLEGDSSLIFRDDFDRNLNFSISLGFRF